MFNVDFIKIIASFFCFLILFQSIGAVFIDKDSSISSQLSKDDLKVHDSLKFDKEWTLMLYDDADFTPGYDPFNDFAYQVSSMDNINVLILQDTYGGPGRLWYVDENHSTLLLEDYGEIDMGSSETLKDFINYCKDSYPANRYFLAVYDHGYAWRGACIDQTDNSLLSISEFQQALIDTGGVDILAFTAPCLMGSLEVIYELRDCVDVYIGSEDLSGFIYWTQENCFNEINNLLNDNIDLSNIEIAEDIIQMIYEHNDPNDPLNGKYLTMSAVRSDMIESLVNSIDILSRDLFKKWFLSSYKKVKNAHDNTFVLADYNDLASYYKLYDLYGFIRQFDELSSAMDVLDIFNQTIIAECHGNAQVGCFGLSIFLPDIILENRTISLYRSRQYSLDFTKDTLWDEFIIIYVLTNTIFNKLKMF